MQIVSIKELRDNLAEIVEQVAIGKKTFIVSKFGKEKVLLSPINKVSARNKSKTKKKIDWAKFEAFGMWRDREDMKDPAKWVRDLRRRESTRNLPRSRG